MRKLESAIARMEGTLAQMHGAIARTEERFGTESLSSHRTATALQAAGWSARSGSQHVPSRAISAESCYSPATPRSLDAELQRLESLLPSIFPIWKNLFNNALEYYDPARQDLKASASVWDNEYSRIFQAYVDLFWSGRVLDIGSGTHGVPSYLTGVPQERISLLDPRQAEFPVRCEYVIGFNEFLPWPDHSFETVVSGTSLDHVLCLETSLAEVARVLTPGGRYIVWLASIPGSPAYRPHAPDFEPRDQFHLFHFDRAWIEPMLMERFEIEDLTVLPQPGFQHLFYCLRPKFV